MSAYVEAAQLWAAPISGISLFQAKLSRPKRLCRDAVSVCDGLCNVLLLSADAPCSPSICSAVSAVLGLLMAGIQGLLSLEAVNLQLAQPVFTRPRFSVSGIIGVALPLFIVTMASQNVPGVTTIRAFGYSSVPISPLIG